MKERRIWLVGLATGIALVLVAAESLADVLTAFAILALGALGAEWITRQGLSKAGR